jgi:hypothetical protein
MKLQTCVRVQLRAFGKCKMGLVQRIKTLKADRSTKGLQIGDCRKISASFADYTQDKYVIFVTNFELFWRAVVAVYSLHVRGQQRRGLGQKGAEPGKK